MDSFKETTRSTFAEATTPFPPPPQPQHQQRKDANTSALCSQDGTASSFADKLSFYASMADPFKPSSSTPVFESRDEGLMSCSPQSEDDPLLAYPPEAPFDTIFDDIMGSDPEDSHLGHAGSNNGNGNGSSTADMATAYPLAVHDDDDSSFVASLARDVLPSSSSSSSAEHDGERDPAIAPVPASRRAPTAKQVPAQTVDNCFAPVATPASAAMFTGQSVLHLPALPPVPRTTIRSPSLIAEEAAEEAARNNGKRPASNRQRVDYDANKNARMAKENRERKKLYVSGLEDQVCDLQKENAARVGRERILLARLDMAQQEIMALRNALQNASALGNILKAISASTASTSATASTAPTMSFGSFQSVDCAPRGYADMREERQEGSSRCSNSGSGSENGNDDGNDDDANPCKRSKLSSSPSSPSNATTPLTSTVIPIQLNIHL